jgi:hypothetical protein
MYSENIKKGEDKIRQKRLKTAKTGDKMGELGKTLLSLLT